MKEDYQQYQIDIAANFKLLSNPARIKIVELLQNKNYLSTSELTKSLPLGRTTVFQHLKVLKDANWIKATTTGYSLNSDVIKSNTLILNRYIENLDSIVTMNLTNNKPSKKLEKILFLCTQNSCRSQMAEGFFNHYRGTRSIMAFSAGTNPGNRIHPLATMVMKEKGIDLTNLKPKSTEVFKGDETIDLVAFVCTMAESDCPYLFPFSRQKLSIPFDDPAKIKGNREEKLTEFRRIRDLIEIRINSLLEEIPEQ